MLTGVACGKISATSRKAKKLIKKQEKPIGCHLGSFSVQRSCQTHQWQADKTEINVVTQACCSQSINAEVSPHESQGDEYDKSRQCEVARKLDDHSNLDLRLLKTNMQVRVMHCLTLQPQPLPSENNQKARNVLTTSKLDTEPATSLLLLGSKRLL